MGLGIQTSNGKAFEYACVLELFKQLERGQQIIIESSPQLQTAEKLYEEISQDMKTRLNEAARAAVKMIKRLEPQLVEGKDNNPLYLLLQADAAGIKGDVRDVLCIRKQNGWEIGLSCKHNHHAVKHSRLSDSIDFGMDWFGVPCSKEYFDKVIPLFSELRKMRDQSKLHGNPTLWNSIENKAERFYIPVLQAFMEELKKLHSENENIPEKMIRYLLGRHDFYKVITDDKNRTTRIEAINITGKLNCSSGNSKSIVKIPILKMPTQFYHIGFKQDSNNTIEVICDEGWQISMRIHSASSKVEPSLKFDVNLISLPSSVHTQIEPWETDLPRERNLRLSDYSRKIKEQ